MENIVILIHGTWGRGLIPFFKSREAAWCKENAKIRIRIKAALGDQVKFERFNWSGRNSLGARLSAAKELKKRVMELASENKNSRLHIVAHSHGGSVFSYAFDESMKNMIGSIIFLSTPFIHLTPVNWGERAGKMLRRIISVSASFAVTAIAFLALPKIDSTTISMKIFTPLFIDTFGSFILFSIMLVTVYLLVYYISKRIHISAKTTANELELPVSFNCPTLIIRDTSDEASLVLNLANLISVITGRLLSFSLAWTLKKRVVLNVRTSALALALTLLASYLLLYINLTTDFSISVFFVAASIILLSFIVPLVTIPIISATIIILSFSILSFGGRKLMLSVLSMRVSSESTPPGIWEVFQLSNPEGVKFSGPSLNHFTHSNKLAIEKIGNWLEQKF